LNPIAPKSLSTVSKIILDSSPAKIWPFKTKWLRFPRYASHQHNLIRRNPQRFRVNIQQNRYKIIAHKLRLFPLEKIGLSIDNKSLQLLQSFNAKITMHGGLLKPISLGLKVEGSTTFRQILKEISTLIGGKI
jgi:hypothetical protein